MFTSGACGSMHGWRRGVCRGASQADLYALFLHDALPILLYVVCTGPRLCTKLGDARQARWCLGVVQGVCSTSRGRSVHAHTRHCRCSIWPGGMIKAVRHKILMLIT